MGKRGPAPLPTNVKLLRGTFRFDRGPQNEPRPEPVVPTCPTWLDREAKREWRRIVGELEAIGLITKIDRAALAAYCQAYAEWWEMEREIKLHGRTQVTENGYVAQRPEVGIRNKALERMRQFLREFGMTPSSRTRIEAPKKEEEPQTRFSKFSGSAGNG